MKRENSPKTFEESLSNKFSIFLSESNIVHNPHCSEIIDLVFIFFKQIINQQFIIDGDIWKTQCKNDNVIKKLLSDTYAIEKDWDHVTIFGRPIIAYIRALNESVHNSSQTIGGKKHYNSIVKIQNGEYCVNCGARHNLVIDHIKPVNLGGHPDDVNNLQLLCQDCNLAKNNYADDLLPILIKIQKNRSISSRIRYKFLFDNSILLDGRNHGVCQECGSTSHDSELKVLIKNSYTAANYLNLYILCNNCKNKEE